MAASNDLTGQGGDWLLEAANGQIEAALAVNETSQYQYAGTLAINTAPSFVVGDGMVTTDMGPHDFGDSVTVQADGKILLSGRNDLPNDIWTDSNYEFTPYFALVRYNHDGSLDTSFNGNGMVTSSMKGSSSSVTVQAEGKILQGGTTSTNPYLTPSP